MPFLHIDYTANLLDVDEAALMAALNAALCAHPTIVDESDLKTTIARVPRWHIGTLAAAQQHSRGFVHARLALLTGRSAEVRRELSDLIATVLHAQLRAPEGVMVQVTVEIAEMNRDSYYKTRL